MSVLKKGIYLQTYRAAIPANTEQQKVNMFFAAFDALSDRRKRAVKGIIPHGFTVEFTVERWKLWVNACEQRGLVCGVAFGLDDSEPAAKGQRIAQFAVYTNCVVMLLDAEGAWDQIEDQAKVALLCNPIVAANPRQLMMTQPWPVPTYHMNFPYQQFAKYTQAVAEQRYYNDWKQTYGTKRYKICESWFDESWGTLEKNVLSRTVPSTIRPHAVTIQGYAWGDIPYDLVTCLCRHLTQPVIVWSDWFPEESFWYGVEPAQELLEREFIGENAVWMFQSSTDTLTIDGLCGPRTREALGVP